MTSEGRTSSQQRIATNEISPGALVAGKFRVERIVGRGGMGIVVEATNVQLDQKVALKLLASRGEDPAVADRFGREARAAARLRSEHVARVYDVGKDTLHGPFIVMEMLEGRTLADVISEGRVPIHRAVEYVIDACEGLAEAHARGIVHQDVKPANLFLVTDTDGRPSIKLLDFGIATVRSTGREADAKSSQPSVGTPAYLAPEQLRGAPAADHRADIWALGCVLYELLVGERPFRASRFTELVTKILETEPEPLPDELQTPAPIAAAIERCLQKDRAKRFTSTGELALTLLPFARRRAHSSVSRAIAHVKSSGLDPHLEMPSSMPPRPSEGSLELPAHAQLRPPGVPVITGDAAPSSAAPREMTAPASAASAPSDRSRRVLGALALVTVIGGGGAGAWALSRPSARSTETGGSSSSIALASVDAPLPGTAPATSSSVAAPTDPASAEPPTPASSRPAEWSRLARPTLPKTVPPRPRPSVAPSSAPVPPPSRDTEIRHVR